MNPSMERPAVLHMPDSRAPSPDPTIPSPVLVPIHPGLSQSPTSPMGLTEAEAMQRLAQGHANHVSFAPSRSYWQILRDNALLSINVIIFAIGVALVLLGLMSDALVTVGLVLLNVLIAVAQEIRAKRALDRIALLNRVQTMAVRDGKERRVDPSRIVAR